MRHCNTAAAQCITTPSRRIGTLPTPMMPCPRLACDAHRGDHEQQIPSERGRAGRNGERTACSCSQCFAPSFPVKVPALLRMIYKPMQRALLVHASKVTLDAC